ncbi:BolA-like [Parasponia andersonii]|uniref:BolA-like n=1 Tax=Parasponia andersonii TaxID=3476 RepID=A0A2P5B845_PARAD|nr:BolA-like [Parasponia andersonii]
MHALELEHHNSVGFTRDFIVENTVAQNGVDETTNKALERVLSQSIFGQKQSALEVIDTSGGCGASFAVEIVSEKFEGKRLLERHRLVNTALEEEMKDIHALSIKKALTPEQWKQQQESENSKTAA